MLLQNSKPRAIERQHRNLLIEENEKHNPRDYFIHTLVILIDFF